MWADDSGRYLLHAYSRAAEGRVADHPDGDLFVRTTRRGAYLSQLLAPPGGAEEDAGGAAGGGQAAGGGGAEDEEEAEGFGYNAGGAVVFDGGSYSVGPLDIGVCCLLVLGCVLAGLHLHCRAA